MHPYILLVFYTITLYLEEEFVAEEEIGDDEPSHHSNNVHVQELRMTAVVDLIATITHTYRHTYTLIRQIEMKTYTY